MFFDQYPLLFIDFFCCNRIFLFNFDAETSKNIKNDSRGTKRDQEQ